VTRREHRRLFVSGSPHYPAVLSVFSPRPALPRIHQLTVLSLHPPAEVEVDSSRRYVAVNDAACELLGYSREELLKMTIDDLSFPSGAHVDPMYTQFLRDGSMRGIFALRRKSGEGILVRFESAIRDGRPVARWTHYKPLPQPEDPGFNPVSAKPDLSDSVSSVGKPHPRR
jgi:PAS domain S-box-containing protein